MVQETYGIAFSSDMEVSSGKAWEDIAGEQLQEMMHVFSRCEARSRKRDAWVNIAEAHASRLVDEDNIGILAPPVFVEDSAITVFIDHAWSQLTHHSKHARRTWASTQP